MNRWMVLILVLAALSLTACDSETSTPAVQPNPTVSPLPVPGISPLSPLSPAQAAAANAAVDYLAGELGVRPGTIEVLAVQAVEWPDTSLGCPQPGMAYATVIVPGYQVLLRAGGSTYDLHSDASGSQMVICND